MNDPELLNIFPNEVKGLINIVASKTHEKACLAIIHIILWYKNKNLPISKLLIKRLLFSVIIEMLFIQRNPDNSYKDMKELDKSITNKKTSYQLATEVVDIFNNILLSTFKPNTLPFPIVLMCSHIGYTDESTGKTISTKSFKDLKNTMFDLIRSSFSDELPNISTLNEKEILPQHKLCYDWHNLEDGTIQDCLTKDTDGLEENILFITPTPKIKSVSVFDYGIICVSKSILRRALRRGEGYFFYRDTSDRDDTDLYCKVTSITVSGNNVYIPLWSLLKILISKQKTFYILDMHDPYRYIATSESDRIVQIAVCEGDLAITPNEWFELENRLETMSRSSSQTTEIYDPDLYDEQARKWEESQMRMSPPIDECISLDLSEIHNIDQQLEELENRKKSEKIQKQEYNQEAFNRGTEDGGIGHMTQKTKSVLRQDRRSRSKPY